MARGGNTYPTRQRAAGVGEASQDMTTNLSWAAKRATGMANSVEANERRLRRESPIIDWDKAIANLLDILDDEPPPAQPERKRNGPPARLPSSNTSRRGPNTVEWRRNSNSIASCASGVRNTRPQNAEQCRFAPICWVRVHAHLKGRIRHP